MRIQVLEQIQKRKVFSWSLLQFCFLLIVILSVQRYRCILGCCSVFNKVFEMYEFVVHSVVDFAGKFVFILKEVKYQHLILSNYMKGKRKLIS